MKRIVLGVDGSDGSIQAARVAGRLTADLGAELTAVHVRHVAPMAWPPAPAAELEQAAGEQRADLIVVGSQGHTVVHRLLLGSVSTRLTHHAQRPVMVVPLT
jgi:nucleotide-binding universal stress UspA family protein